MKLHLFLDESGTSDLTNIDPNFPILALTGVLITDDAYTELKVQINTLKAKYFPGKQVVLHRRDMRKYERGFEIFFDDSLISSIERASKSFKLILLGDFLPL